MNVQAVTALVSGVAGLIVAVTGLITALRAHGRITGMQSSATGTRTTTGTK